MSVCPSTTHETPVKATVPGTFTNWFNPDKSGPVTYCAHCARSIEALGFFKADEPQQ